MRYLLILCPSSSVLSEISPVWQMHAVEEWCKALMLPATRDTSGNFHGPTSTARIITLRFAGNVRLLTVFALLIAKL